MSRPPSAPSAPGDALRTSVNHSAEHGESPHERQQVHSGAAPQASAVDRSTWSRSGPEVWTTEARNVLADDFRATLQPVSYTHLDVYKRQVQ